MTTFHLHHSWFTNIARILTAALTGNMSKSKQHNVTIIGSTGKLKYEYNLLATYKNRLYSVTVV